MLTHNTTDFAPKTVHAIESFTAHGDIVSPGEEVTISAYDADDLIGRSKAIEVANPQKSKGQ